VADACRADGVEWLVAAADSTSTDLLRREGFVPATNLPGVRAGWLARQV
jgi:hypothetical protein